MRFGSLIADTPSSAPAELERDGITITLDEFDSEIVMLERVEG